MIVLVRHGTEDNPVVGCRCMSQVDVAFNVLDQSVVDIYWLTCRFPSSHLSSTCSSSDPGFHFHQLTHVAFVVAHVVY